MLPDQEHRSRASEKSLVLKDASWAAKFALIAGQPIGFDKVALSTCREQVSRNTTGRSSDAANTFLLTGKRSILPARNLCLWPIGLHCYAWEGWVCSDRWHSIWVLPIFSKSSGHFQSHSTTLHFHVTAFSVGLRISVLHTRLAVPSVKLQPVSIPEVQ